MFRVCLVSGMIGVLAIGAWFVARDTPVKAAKRWRREVRSILATDPTRLHEASELNQRVLEVFPTSTIDLLTKAQIAQRAGSAEQLHIALCTYDEMLRLQPEHVHVALWKAEACREYGLYEISRGTLLSVSDYYPIRVHLELGNTALSGLRTPEARRHFSDALDRAETESQIAAAHIGAARSYEIDRLLAAARAQKSHEARRLERKHLELALTALEACERPLVSDDACDVLLKIVDLSERLSRVSEEGDTPLWEGVLLFQKKIKEYQGITDEHDPRIGSRILALRIAARTNEGTALADYLDPHQRDVFQTIHAHLGLSVSEAESRLQRVEQLRRQVEGSAGELEVLETDAYIHRLVSVARAFLTSGRQSRIVSDTSRLNISKRVDDAIASGAQGTTPLRYLRAFAEIHSGNKSRGLTELKDYWRDQSKSERPELALELAELAHTAIPGTTILFRFLDSLKTKPLYGFHRRIQLLLSACGQKATRKRAHQQMEALLQRAEESSTGKVAQEFAWSRSRLLESKQLVATFRAQTKRSPLDMRVKDALAEQLYFAVESVNSQAQREEALRAYLSLYFYAPEKFSRVRARIRKLVEGMTAANAREIIAEHIQLIEGHDSGVLEFTNFLLPALLGDARTAAQRAEAVDPELFTPHFNRLYAETLRDLAATSISEKRSLHAKSNAVLGRQPTIREYDHLSSEVLALPHGTPLPDALFVRIERFYEASGESARGAYLMALAWRQRFGEIYDDPEIRNSDLAEILLRERALLREAIRSAPDLEPAYMALAETHVREGTSQPESRRIRRVFVPDYERALSLLAAVPHPSVRVLRQRARYMELAGFADAQLEALEKLVLELPSSQAFIELLNSALSLNEYVAEVIIERDARAAAALQRFDPAQQDRLKLLKTEFDKLSEADAVRHFIHGCAAARKERTSLHDGVKNELRKRTIQAYTAALDAYDALESLPPAELLTDLAARLADEDDAALRRRSLHLARRALEQAEPTDEHPELLHTYAWSLYRNGRPTEARRQFEELIGTKDAPIYRYHYAKVLYDLGAAKEATEQVQRSLELPQEFTEEAEARRWALSIQNTPDAFDRIEQP